MFACLVPARAESGVPTNKTFSKKLNLPSKETDVITITGKDKFLGEALILGDKQIILEIYNYNLLLKKIPNTIKGWLLKRLI